MSMQYHKDKLREAFGSTAFGGAHLSLRLAQIFYPTKITAGIFIPAAVRAEPFP
jgi:hypothetical protein